MSECERYKKNIFPPLIGRNLKAGNLSFIKMILLNIFTNPSSQVGYDSRSMFKRSLTGFNSEFSFSLTSCFTKAEEPSLSFYLPIAGGRIIGFIAFPRVLVLCEMQSVFSRIWTRVAVSISYDDNNYTITITPRAPPWFCYNRGSIPFQVESFQRLKKWYLMPPYLTINIIRYVSMVSTPTQGKNVIPHCSSYSKGSFWVSFDWVLPNYVYVKKARKITL